MPLINFKVELKVKWSKYCALPAVCADNENANPDYIIFNIKDPKLYLSLVTLSAETIKICQNFLAKDLTDHFIGTSIKQKARIKIEQINIYIYIFSNQNFLEPIDFL